VISFFVPGIPRPGGSKRAIPFKRTNGKLGTRVTDMGTYTPEWRASVENVAAKAMGETFPFEGALRIDVTFFMPRPKHHYGKKGLKPAYQDAMPTKKPDAIKLMRALEDALTSICWFDDAQITDEHILKRYSTRPMRPGALVMISRVQETLQSTELNASLTINQLQSPDKAAT
jgi:crossover junction endodeoxyribonuclease RusA